MKYVSRRSGFVNYIPSPDDKFDAKLLSWFGNNGFQVLHVENQGHTVTYTVWCPDTNGLIIARVFSLGDNMEISIDKEFEFSA